MKKNRQKIDKKKEIQKKILLKTSLGQLTQINEISTIRFQLVDPETRKKQLERILPNGRKIGEIQNSLTLNYKTLKPEKGGFFCEAIFGPTQDFLCSCGRTQKQNFYCICCPDCDVEHTTSKVRRYRLGFIELAVPVAHIWYLKGRPSYFSLFFDLKKKQTELISYSTGQIINAFTDDFEKKIYSQRKEYHERFLKWRKSKDQIKRMPKINEVLSFPDDFWVRKPRSKIKLFGNYDRYFYFVRGRWRPMTRFYYHKNKPFYPFPFVRDSFSLPLFYYTCNNLIDIFVDYPEKRDEAGIVPIPKYKRGIPNSRIFDPYKPRTIQTWFLRGGNAFLHLFSRIDCRRFEKCLIRRLNNLQRRIYMLTKITVRQGFITKWQKAYYKDLVRKITKFSRRVKLIRLFRRTNSRPEWMLISILPVLPPDLRPIIQLPGDQLAISDLNALYQRVFYRNKALKKLQPYANRYFSMGPVGKTPTLTMELMAFHERLLHEAVDDLLENGKQAEATPSASPSRPVKSISDFLKGKKGRFRQNLLGKRVDYSGRSVIVVGPSLKLHECGLPKEIAVELFQSLLIRKLLKRKIVKTIVDAKLLIRADHPVIWPILNEIMWHWPILLNRAPTLHRLGVQAFLPKLVRGKAILLHPLVCSAFNADFDGDQMGVHLPISLEAKSEAWSLMLSTQNLLSPATSEPIVLPSQDMVLGCYYVTTMNPKRQEKNIRYFTNLSDVVSATLNQNLHPHTWIWLRLPILVFIDSDQKNDDIFEIRINSFGEKIYLRKTSYQMYHRSGKLKTHYLRTTVGRTLFNHLLHHTINESKLKYYENKNKIVEKKNKIVEKKKYLSTDISTNIF